MRRPAAVPPRPARRQRQRQRAPRQRRFPVWPLLLGLVLLAVAVAGILLVNRDDGTPSGSASAAPVTLTGIASYDPPPGDGDEHSERVADATDGNPATYWTTESYQSFSKPGVGLVLKVDGTPKHLMLTTDTPGFNAEIRSGSSPDGPFDTVVAGDARTAPTTTWELGDTDAPYLVVWITALDGRAHVNEVKATG